MTPAAVICDFDDTLAPDSTSAFLAHIGIDVERFWGHVVKQRMDDGWDPAMAYLYEFIHALRERSVTRSDLSAFGRTLELFPGVHELFSSIRKEHPWMEFYVISSGIGDILRACTLAPVFTSIFTSELFYENDIPVYPKNAISFTDKTRYLFQISKGMHGPEYRTKPFEVNRRIDSADARIPFKRMLYIGDGYTDVPCFALLMKNGGQALAVYDAKSDEKRMRGLGFVNDRRVIDALSCDYSVGGKLNAALAKFVEMIQ
ncbi:MAG: haloacid dehalogenase-like hydrolase [Spirochaetota bacterium]